MKLKPWALPAFIIAGSFGLATTSVATNDRSEWRSERFSEHYSTYAGDDQSLAPGVPGITEDNISDMSRRQVRVVQEVLKDEGYFPGRADGVMDDETRDAIRDFQRDHDLVVTGTVDNRTAEALGIQSDLSG